MKIGIIGTGNMGGGLGRIWAGKGHEVLFASRDLEAANVVAKSAGASAGSGTNAEAAAFGDAILLAVPWASVPDAIEASGSLSGKILIDCSMPLAADYMSLTIGHTTSGAEEVAGLAPGAKVVKAFNTVPAAVIQVSPEFGSQAASVFYCGDDVDAKKVVGGLIADAGFEGIDSGPLKNARLIEPFTELLIQLAFVQGLGVNIAYKLLRR